MDTTGTPVIHANPALKHQGDIGLALLEGFAAHGIRANLAFDATTQGDFHVVLGPWFAFKEFRRHENTLYIDRAYWGDPDNISIHWLRHGEKLFKRTESFRPHPPLQPLKTGNRAVYLCDYGELPPEGAAHRRHPADVKPTESLASLLGRYDIANGRRTTALVDAAIAGLRVYTTDRFSPVFGIIQGRQRWIKQLAHHNWSLEEIRSGDAWAQFQK